MARFKEMLFKCIHTVPQGDQNLVDVNVFNQCLTGRGCLAVPEFSMVVSFCPIFEGEGISKIKYHLIICA